MIGPACWLKLFGCFSLLVDDGTISLHLEHGSVPRQFFAIDFEHFSEAVQAGGTVHIHDLRDVAYVEEGFFRGVSCLQT